MSAPDVASRWQRGLIAAAVLAIAPATIGGVRLRAQAGPVRDAWLAALRLFAGAVPIAKMPASIDESRLLGGLDLAATLAGGRPVATQGFLAGMHGGIVVAAMAERLPVLTAAHLAGVLDRGAVVLERDGVTMMSPARIAFVALDEGIDTEELLPALADRLAIVIDLAGIAPREASPPAQALVDAIDLARERITAVQADDDMLSTFCRAALALGIDSLRPPLHAVAVARALAALDGRSTVDDDDARMAAALVLAPRALQLPAAQDEQQEPPEAEDPESEEQPDSSQQNPADATPLDDVVMEAAQAALPPGLLARLAGGHAVNRVVRQRGKAGARNANAQHGRRLGARAGTLRSGAKLDLVATLRAAAPWQTLRRRDGAPLGGSLAIRTDDLRIARFEERARTVTIFLVDASGSAARERLAEAKGAVRLMLADCYIRRDEVALLAFRRDCAELLLPPTRSLVRAERTLAALPGGGGTPLAAGLDAATQLARAEASKGRTPTLVVMSDGRANVARDGSGGRPRAHEQALEAARVWRADGQASAFIDTSSTPGQLAAEIAATMGARYVPLPHADARSVNAAVRALGRAP